MTDAPRKRGRPRAYDPDQALERARSVFWDAGYASSYRSSYTSAAGKFVNASTATRDKWTQLSYPGLAEAFTRSDQLQSELGDLFSKFVQFIDDLLTLQTCQALQLHLKDGLGLKFAEFELCDQIGAGFGRSLRGADQRDNGINVVQCLLKAFEDMGARFSLTQLVLASAANNVDSMFDEVAQQLEKIENFRLAVDYGEIDYAKGRLHLRQLVEVV